MPNYLEIIKSEKYDDIRKIFDANKPVINDQDKAKMQYHVSDHDVMQNIEGLRPDKTIYKPYMNDSTGEPVTDSVTGKPKTYRATSKVNRVAIPFQEIIVTRRVGFMLGNPIKYDVTYDETNTKEKAVVEYIYSIEDDAKTLYKNKELARRVMSELETAELWYLTEVKETGVWNFIAKSIGIKAPKYQLRMKVLSPWLGDIFYPLYDEYGDMIAFARSYKLKEDDKEIDRFDVYTAEFTYKYANRDGFALDANSPGGGRIPNLAKKIPVIYHTQVKPEWANVQGMIDRIEKLLSNHSDMNDYFGEPILAIFGELIQAINKGESGKILQLSENAKASFLALDTPPESIKMEVENLEKFIYAMSQTPNISFSEMKELGKDISGFAITLLFLDAHLAVRAKEETFGIGIQRRVNLIKAFIGNILDVSLLEASQSVRMKPVFTPYMPKDMKELIDMIGQAVNSGVMSKKTGTEKLEDAGFIANAEQEQERLDEEAMADLSNPTI